MANTISSNGAALKWGVIDVVISIVLIYIYQLLNVDQTSSVKYINYIPFIAFMLLAQKEYKDQLGGYLTFGASFVVGLKYSIIIGVLMAIFMYLYYTLFSPQIYQQIIDATRQQLEAKGTLTSDQIDMSLKFTTPGFIAIFMVIGSIIGGCIISLICSAFMKKDPPPFVADENITYSDPTV